MAWYAITFLVYIFVEDLLQLATMIQHIDEQSSLKGSHCPRASPPQQHNQYTVSTSVLHVCKIYPLTELPHNDAYRDYGLNADTLPPPTNKFNCTQEVSSSNLAAVYAGLRVFLIFLSPSAEKKNDSAALAADLSSGLRTRINISSSETVVASALRILRRAMGWTARVRFPAVKDFYFSTASRLTLGPTQSPTQRVPGTLSPGVKRHGRLANHSPPSSTEVKKKGGAIPPLPCLHDIVLN
jgi:hypothetical protein